MNDAQRKAMEQAIEDLLEADGYGAGNFSSTVAALRAELDADQRSGYLTKSSIEKINRWSEKERPKTSPIEPTGADQQIAEPVAWMYTYIGQGKGVRLLEKRAEAPEGGWVDYKEMPLYVHPQPAEPTEAQIEAGARNIALAYGQCDTWESIPSNLKTYYRNQVRACLQAAMSVKE